MKAILQRDERSTSEKGGLVGRVHLGFSAACDLGTELDPRVDTFQNHALVCGCTVTDALLVGASTVLASTVHGVKTGGAPMREKKPNILILWGDDIGFWNISANNRGMMGYRAPITPRLA